MEYQLKDKIPVTKNFFNELIEKSWQDIEHLQSQIASIEPSTENKVLLQLFKNLLTSYYVFAGGLENLASGENLELVNIESDDQINPTEISFAEMEPESYNAPTEPYEATFAVESTDDNFEPFEYFVDFDEPFGEPLSDEDLYGRK
jgi:hypothetical protein